jgi:hypothetical protein
VEQLVRLYGTLAAGLTDDAVAPKVSELLARIAVYQTYEIVTDDLGMGLFGPAAATRAAGARRALLRSFNAAMTVRLRGPRTAAALLRPQRRLAAPLCSPDPTADGRLSAERLAARRDPWPVLVANIEAGADVADLAADTLFGTLVRDGLAERYRAVSRTLAPRHLSRVELAAVGAHSVLVAPTLAYVLAVLTDLTASVPGLAAVVDDGTLAEALYDAAMLSRLLNDVGTDLVRLGHRARHDALQQARRKATKQTPPRLALTGPAFNRLAKDLRYGEFSLCLYAARRAPDVATAFDALESDLDHFCRLYALHRRRLEDALSRLTDRLADPRPATLIRRFVRFHTRLYAHRYDDPAGEYAASA